MSLRLRLGLLLALVILLTASTLVLLTRKGVVDPLAREVMRELVGQALDVARRVEEGADAAELGERLGLEVELHPRAPPFGTAPRDRRNWRPLRGPGGRVWVRRGPEGSAIAVATRRGWVVVRRALDLERPGRGVLLAGAAATALSLVLAALLSGLATRPIRVTMGAMERVARGELGHRLPEEGPRELVEAARAFNAMAARVERLLRTERELLAGVSHELRTPLARMRLALELLREGGEPAPLLTSLETDLEEAERAIAAMLRISRLELGEPVRTRPIDPLPVVRAALERVDLGGREVRVEGRGTTVEADPAALERILVNLLGNVARHTPEGSPVLVHLEGPTVQVLDRGPGVPEEEIEGLFEPFRRLRGGGAGGLGMGLALARRLAELQGGSLAAANRPGGGLAVTLRLAASGRSRGRGEGVPAPRSPGA